MFQTNVTDVNSAVNHVVDPWDGKSIKTYTGSPPAALADAATGTLLCTHTFPTPAFGDSASGVAAAAAITAVSGVASGAMGYRRIYDGTTCLAQWTIGKAFELLNWVKVSDNKATADLPSGHGLSSGADFSVLWTGGGRSLCYGEISANALTLYAGIGDAFPASGTNVTAGQGDELANDVDVSASTLIGIDLLAIGYEA